MALANHAAGVAVSKSGTAIVTPGEILASLQLSDPLTEPASLHLCNSWRSAGDKIAFANGCFDLLHPGHISLLRHAAKTADRLIIGLNSDASVRRLKGDSRPLQSADNRAAALAAFDMVDAVTIFNEDTPKNLIALLQPDFIVKGGDYEADNVVGNDIVKKWGGKVVIAPTLLIIRHQNLLKPSSDFLILPTLASTGHELPTRMIVIVYRSKSTQQWLASFLPKTAMMIQLG